MQDNQDMANKKTKTIAIFCDTSDNSQIVKWKVVDEIICKKSVLKNIFEKDQKNRPHARFQQSLSQAAEYSGLSTLLVELLSKVNLECLPLNLVFKYYNIYHISFTYNIQVNLESLPLPLTSFIICFVTVRSHFYIKCPFLGLGASFGQFSSNGISFHHELIFAMGLEF